MVCLPCFIVPLLLYVFHKFIQPFILKFWNPWEKKDEKGNVIKQEPKLYTLDCKDGVCKFSLGKSKEIASQEIITDGNSASGHVTSEKKDK